MTTETPERAPGEPQDAPEPQAATEGPVEPMEDAQRLLVGIEAEIQGGQAELARTLHEGHEHFRKGMEKATAGLQDAGLDSWTHQAAAMARVQSATTGVLMPKIDRATTKAIADRTRPTEKGFRTITVAATIRHLDNGRLAPVRAYTRQVTQGEYDTRVNAAIQHGVESIIAVLRRDPTAIPDAFRHPRLGPIGLDFEGAKHIVDQRIQQYGDVKDKDPQRIAAAVLMDIARAAILGHPQEDLGPAKRDGKRIPSRIALIHEDHEVIVEPGWRTKHPDLAKGQTTWIVTGYRMQPNRKQAREKEKDNLAVKFDSGDASALKGPKK